MASGALQTDSGRQAPRIIDAFRSRAFAVVFVAESQSIAGDQLARVALAVLVFRRTG
jgi:hypothetical protein